MGKEMSSRNSHLTAEERREDALQEREERDRMITDDEMDWIVETLQRGLDEGDGRISTGATKLVKQLRNRIKRQQESRRMWFNRDVKRKGFSDRRMWSKWEISAMAM